MTQPLVIQLVSRALVLTLATAPAFADTDPFQVPQPSAPPQSQDSQNSRSGAQTAAALGAAAAGAAAGLHGIEAAKAAAQGDQSKAAEEAAKMAAQLAQMAANLAAMGGNEKGKDAAKAADPVQAPPKIPTTAATPTKESPSSSLPQASPSESAETGEEPVSTSSPLSTALAEQISPERADGQEIDESVFGKNFNSDIPESIPFRAKLGYDENGDGSVATSGGTFTSISSLSSRQDKSLSPLQAASVRDRGAKEPTHGEGSSESSGSESDSTTSKAGSPDLQSMLGAVFGVGDTGAKPAAVAAGSVEAGLNAQNRKVFHRELADIGALNIFQYASQRYQKLARDEKSVRVRLASVKQR